MRALQNERREGRQHSRGERDLTEASGALPARSGPARGRRVENGARGRWEMEDVSLERPSGSNVLPVQTEATPGRQATKPESKGREQEASLDRLALLLAHQFCLCVVSCVANVAMMQSSRVAVSCPLQHWGF